LIEIEANLIDNSNREYNNLHEFDIVQNNDDNIQVNPLSAALGEFDKILLRQFCNKMKKLKHTLCPTCNEYFLSITLVIEECYHCHTEKTSPKKFSTENNMDPGNVPEELQRLIEIKEMLIAQVFPVIVVYRLRGEQYGYSGNIINFPQDVEEFVTHLHQNPSSLNVLIIC
ncbi:15848_t:CDS:1, partial [Racocetra fulgida]